MSYVSYPRPRSSDLRLRVKVSSYNVGYYPHTVTLFLVTQMKEVDMYSRLNLPLYYYYGVSFPIDS